MKKLMLLILVLVVFIICPFKAKAITNSGKLYEVFYGSSGVNVFAKDTTYNSMDYNGWIIVSSQDSNIYYCIDPARYMQNVNDAKASTHTIIYDDANIKKYLNVSDSNYEKIKLLIYYGYGYKDGKVDHTNRKWYGITQVMLWRIIRPDINYKFKNGRYGSVNTNLYINEVNELESLVNNHYKTPEFDNNSYEIIQGGTLEIKDKNNMLRSYDISSSSNVSYKVDKDKLIITALKEGVAKISFNRKKVNTKAAFLTSSNLQNLFMRGDVSYKNKEITINIKLGKVKIHKTYKGEFYENLIGTKFNIYNVNDEKVSEFTISKNEEEVFLPVGEYYIKEEEATLGYKLNENKYYFSITGDSDVVELNIDNEPIKGILKIYKYKVKNKKEKVESGAVFNIYDKNNNLVSQIKTDKNGYAEAVLDYGIYTVRQVKGDNKYHFVEDFELVVKEETSYEYKLKDEEIAVTEIITNVPDTYAE